MSELEEILNDWMLSSIPGEFGRRGTTGRAGSESSLDLTAESSLDLSDQQLATVLLISRLLRCRSELLKSVASDGVSSELAEEFGRAAAALGLFAFIVVRLRQPGSGGLPEAPTRPEERRTGAAASVPIDEEVSSGPGRPRTGEARRAETPTVKVGRGAAEAQTAEAWCDPRGTAEALEVALELTNTMIATIKARVHRSQGEAPNALLAEIARLARARASLRGLRCGVMGEAWLQHDVMGEA